MLVISSSIETPEVLWRLESTESTSACAADREEVDTGGAARVVNRVDLLGERLRQVVQVGAQRVDRAAGLEDVVECLQLATGGGGGRARVVQRLWPVHRAVVHERVGGVAEAHLDRAVSEVG